MEEIRISEFKAKCIGLIKRVHQNHQPLVVTLRGKPLVTIEPMRPNPKQRQFGVLRGQVRIVGDIVQHDWAHDWDDGIP